jgi:Domain of unknown function (DUF4334)/GXWXG protein
VTSTSDRLAELAFGATPGQALAFFDHLPTVGVLEIHGWYGKEMVDPETVHPLLFRDRSGRPRPINPAVAPLTLIRSWPGIGRLPGAPLAFAAVRPLLQTHRPTARLRTVEHRGGTTTAIVYDRLPVIDVFRRVDDGALLGVMDLRGLTQPFFFVLRRDLPEPVAP